MASSTTQATLNRLQLYRVTNRILNANSLHFILISFLFIPFAFFASTAVLFYFTPSSGTTTEFDPFNLILFKTIIASSQNLLTVKTLTTAFAFTCFIILPTVAGVALITYSTGQAIHRKPLTFSSTLKSLSRTFVPVLHTVIAGSVKPIILFLAFTLSSIGVTEAINALAFRFQSDLFLSIFINSIVSCVLAIAIVFCIVIWGSAAAITVLESKSGIETLRQSANQSIEFRRHSFSVVFTTGNAIGLGLYLNTCVFQNSGAKANWILILHVGAVCLQSSLMILMYVVANTVLYVQGKVGREEGIAKTTVEGEASGEDVRLLVNDKDTEVFSEVAMADANGSFLYLLTIVWVILGCVQIYNTVEIIKRN